MSLLLLYQGQPIATITGFKQPTYAVVHGSIALNGVLVLNPASSSLVSGDETVVEILT